MGCGALATTGIESGFNGLFQNVVTFVDSTLLPQSTRDCTPCAWLAVADA